MCALICFLERWQSYLFSIFDFFHHHHCYCSYYYHHCYCYHHHHHHPHYDSSSTTSLPWAACPPSARRSAPAPGAPGGTRALQAHPAPGAHPGCRHRWLLAARARARDPRDPRDPLVPRGRADPKGRAGSRVRPVGAGREDPGESPPRPRWKWREVGFLLLSETGPSSST